MTSVPSDASQITMGRTRYHSTSCKNRLECMARCKNCHRLEKCPSSVDCFTVANFEQLQIVDKIKIQDYYRMYLNETYNRLKPLLQNISYRA